MSSIEREIGGRLRTISFTQGTLILLQDRLENQDEDVRKAFAMPLIVWAGLKTNCVLEKKRFTKTVDGVDVGASFEDVCEWVDKLDEAAKVEILSFYTEVFPPKEDTAAVPIVDEKKNLMDTATPETVTNLPAES